MEVLEELSLDELARFVQRYHPGLAQLPYCVLRKMLVEYRETTLIYRREGQLEYFAIYQEWPDFLNFFAVGGKRSYFGIMWHILHNKFMLPAKPFGFYDELRMEGRILCQH